MSVRIKWFPPSWVQIKSRDRTVYIDPAYLKSYYRQHPSKIEFSSWPDPIDGLPEELEPADVILLTHDHKDHAKDVTIKRLVGDHTRIIGTRRCSEKLKAGVTIIEPGQHIAEKGIRIKAVHAYNTEKGSSTRKVHRKGQCNGYLIHLASKAIYHAGDTDFIPEMKTLGSVDVALLPIGGTFTMDLHEAVRAAVAIGARIVIPMHRSKADPEVFRREVASKSDSKVLVPDIGETFFAE
jgi:L-ascorbate metabolism protein UlaG (beta-lactamase superfamily)